VLIDFGSGTGTLAILAAKSCRRVHAVDVSAAMIEHAGTKAAGQGVANIEFHQAGFLTYEHNGPPVDVIVTTLAFHHLPDFWKGIALKRLFAMLTPGGRLYMHDVILEEPDAIKNIAAFIDTLAQKGGWSMKEDVERHFKDEFSTYDWVMDGLLTRSGFTIRSKNIDGGVLGTYLCVKG
ncbi:MAG TPA: class I SAM-dependent methyltransferase, partial [Desulfobacteraceae bacterium]|nr:class I SAM-dependent methyltransferase [Desulfobacteraceae bacterium]